MKKYFVMMVLAAVAMQAMGQELKMEKVPKQMGLETGYIYTFQNQFNPDAGSGYFLLFDYAWKLSGFHKKASAYISVPLGYSMYNASAGNPVSVLSYGWTVRHELNKSEKAVPFLGYGLLLNQLRQQNIDGSIFGHQTKFEFGYNFHPGNKWEPYVKAEYSMTRFPNWQSSGSKWIQSANIVVGIRMNRK